MSTLRAFVLQTVSEVAYALEALRIALRGSGAIVLLCRVRILTNFDLVQTLDFHETLVFIGFGRCF